jgi:hypothetical protein
MSLYIQPENQQLLWDILNTNQLLCQLLVNHTQDQKVAFFKSVIELFYEQNQYKVLDRAGLQQVNRDTIAFIIQKLNANAQQHMSTNYLVDQRQSVLTNPLVSAPLLSAPLMAAPPLINYTPQQQREDAFAKQFADKQREYEALLERKPPTEVDFREKGEIPVLSNSNMEELIRRQQAEREAEAKRFLEQQQQQLVTNPGPGSKDPTLTIDRQQNISLELGPDAIVEVDKQVKWMDEALMAEIKEQRNELIELKQSITSLSSTVEQLTGLLSILIDKQK